MVVSGGSRAAGIFCPRFSGWSAEFRILALFSDVYLSSFEIWDVYWGFCVEYFIEIYALEEWMLFYLMNGSFCEVIFAHTYSELWVELEEFCDDVFGRLIEVL